MFDAKKLMQMRIAELEDERDRMIANMVNRDLAARGQPPFCLGIGKRTKDSHDERS